jgi:hypothetical protein
VQPSSVWWQNLNDNIESDSARQLCKSILLL